MECVLQSRLQCARALAFGVIFVSLLFPGVVGPPAPIPLSVKVRRGFKIACSSALDHTSSFPVKSWEVLAKKGEPRGPQNAVVNAGCYIPCNKTKVLTSLDALC